MNAKNEHSRRKASVKTKLIAVMILIAAIPLSVSILINYFASTSKSSTDAKETLEMEASYIQSEFASIARNTETALKTLASSSTTIDFVMTGDESIIGTVKDQMREVNSCFDDKNVIVLSDIHGQMILRSDDSALTDISSRSYFQKAIAGEANVSNVLVSKSTGTRSICIAVPVWDHDHKEIIGCLHRNYDINNFHELLKANAKEAFLIDNEGLLAAHSQYEITPDDEPTDFSKSPYMTSGKSSDTYISTDTGVKTYVSYVKEPISGYTVCSARSVSDVSFEARRNAATMAILGLLMLIVVVVISVLMANSFTKPIIAVDGILSALAEGKFTHIDDHTDRTDEFGDMVRNSNSVIDKLEQIVHEIKISSQSVDSSATGLAAMATQIASTTDNVAEAVQQIAAGAVDQADAIQRSAEHSGQITTAVESVQNTAAELSGLAFQMKKASEDSGSALNSFRSSSDQMNDKIAEIADRIASTRHAVSDIDARVTGISDIASRTKLLSLNASIEAARAGDTGLGFSVVAEEIRKLADSSGSLVTEINTLMTTLVNESEEAVASANEIIESNKAQQASLTETLAAVQGMLADIETTVNSISAINAETVKCVESNKEVTDAMSSLSAISEENAASSETTGASVEELSATVTVLAESADQLKTIADALIENIGFFK